MCSPCSKLLQQDHDSGSRRDHEMRYNPSPNEWNLWRMTRPNVEGHVPSISTEGRQDQGRPWYEIVPRPDANSHCFKGQRYPFALRSSRRCLLHPRRIVRSGVSESALGKNLTYLKRFNIARMRLAVIAAGGRAFFACFSCCLHWCHLDSPRSSRSSLT